MNTELDPATRARLASIDALIEEYEQDQSVVDALRAAKQWAHASLILRKFAELMTTNARFGPMASGALRDADAALFTTSPPPDPTQTDRMRLLLMRWLKGDLRGVRQLIEDTRKELGS